MDTVHSWGCDTCLERHRLAVAVGGGENLAKRALSDLTTELHAGGRDAFVERQRALLVALLVYLLSVADIFLR